MSWVPLFAATLEREGVDTTFVQRVPAPSMLALVGVDRAGLPTYSFPIADGADRQVVEPSFPAAWRADLQAALFGSYIASLDPTAAVMRGIARRLRPDCVIGLDPNVRLAIAADPEAWRVGIEAFMPLADIVKASEDDILNAYGADATPASVAQAWLARGPSLVVVTRGASGATAYLGGGSDAIEAPAPATEVVDTVGAGDSFLAAIVAFLAQRRALARNALATLDPALAGAALRYAVAAAAITCSRRGADLPRGCDLAP